MPSLLDPISEAAKVLYIGDSGSGKTGSKAALVAAGYKLRMIDTDRGFKILRSLLTDSRFPYADYMKKHGVNPAEPGRISYVPIDVPIDFQSVSVQRRTGTMTYNVLAPVSASAWSTVVSLLKQWKDGDQNLGPVTDWNNDEVLDFDTLSTLAELAHYWVQDMNGHLGQLDDDHGRDTGGAQELIRRLMTKLTSPSIRCNVIVTSHITYVDTSRGAPQSPEALLRAQKAVDARGFPSVIGRALSPVLGKKWNDLFICARSGSSTSAERRIYSTPVANTDAKHSAWVEPHYSIQTGLAEIFAALHYTTVLPNGDSVENFTRSILGKSETSDEGQGRPKSGGFGSRP